MLLLLLLLPPPDNVSLWSCCSGALSAIPHTQPDSASNGRAHMQLSASIDATYDIKSGTYCVSRRVAFNLDIL